MKRDVQSPRRPWHPPLRVKRGTLYCGPRVTAPPSRSGPQMNEGVTLGDVGVTDPTRLHGACRRVRDPLLCPCGPRVTLTVRSSKEECTARSYLGCRLCGGTCLMTCTVQGTKVHPEERASCESWFLHAAGQGRYTVTTSPVAENGLGLLFGFNLRCILINAGALLFLVARFERLADCEPPASTAVGVAIARGLACRWPVCRETLVRSPVSKSCRSSYESSRLPAPPLRLGHRGGRIQKAAGARAGKHASSGDDRLRLRVWLRGDARVARARRRWRDARHPPSS